MFLWLKTRHETVIRRTVLRSQRAKQKPNRWSWGGALQPNTPSIPAGTFIFFFLKIPVLYESYLSLQCKYLFLPFHVSIFLSCLHSIFIFRFPCSLLYLLTHTQLCLSLSLSLPYYYSLTFSCSWISSLVCFSAIVFCPRGPGFVESAFLYPLDLAGLEHMQSAFSFYRRYGMTSQCEYYGTLSLSQPVSDNWL